MDWEPLSEVSLWEKINEAEIRMNPQQARLWEVVRIPPTKWSEKSYGEAGNGFWAVAVVGPTVIWYNDIEEGFNRSHYSNFGIIDDYWCNQDELEETLQNVINVIETGQDATARRGPPTPGKFISN